MKPSKILSLFLISGILGFSLGIGASISQKEETRIREQKALETIEASDNMEFLLKAQKAIEIRKYAIYDASRDQMLVMPVKKSKSKSCEKGSSENAANSNCDNNRK